MKIIKEAGEKTAFINNRPIEYRQETELRDLKDNPDVYSIKTAKGKQIKEEEGEDYTSDQILQIAKEIGPILKNALQQDNSEVRFININNATTKSFNLKVAFKSGVDDIYSFYLKNNAMYLEDTEITPLDLQADGQVGIRRDLAEKSLYNSITSTNTPMDPNQEPDLNEKIARINAELAEETTKKLEMLRESLQKQISEAESGMVATDDEDTAADLAKQGVNVKLTSEMKPGDEESQEHERMKRLSPKDQETIAKIHAMMQAEKDAKNEEEEIPVADEVPEEPEAEGDLDVGHQDDEPSMVKNDVYDIAVYAAKLYKQLDKYDQMDGEVDFPHWWQSKVVKAREYISSAQHYLEAEEKQPIIAQLALEGVIKEGYNPELVKYVNRFVGGLAKKYDYDTQSAVDAIMGVLRQQKWDGVNEEDKWTRAAAEKRKKDSGEGVEGIEGLKALLKSLGRDVSGIKFKEKDGKLVFWFGYRNKGLSDDQLLRLKSKYGDIHADFDDEDDRGTNYYYVIKNWGERIEEVEQPVQEAKKVDIMYALKEIQKYNRGDRSIESFEDMVYSIVKHLGYKSTTVNINNAMDHLGESMDADDGIPQDRTLVQELYGLLV